MFVIPANTLLIPSISKGTYPHCNASFFIFKGDSSLVGKIVSVKITESHTYSLIGELVNE